MEAEDPSLKVLPTKIMESEPHGFQGTSESSLGRELIANKSGLTNKEMEISELSSIKAIDSDDSDNTISKRISPILKGTWSRVTRSIHTNAPSLLLNSSLKNSGKRTSQDELSSTLVDKKVRLTIDGSSFPA